MTTPDYAEKIPNNVGLAEDRRLQRALESWQPDFLSWWETMGPTEIAAGAASGSLSSKTPNSM